MFDRFFGPKPEKTPEEKEKELKFAISMEFKDFVNSPAIYNAFRAAAEKNRTEALGFTDEQLLEFVKTSAHANASAVEDVMMDGREEVTKAINGTIEEIRKQLSE